MQGYDGVNEILCLVIFNAKSGELEFVVVMFVYIVQDLYPTATWGVSENVDDWNMEKVSSNFPLMLVHSSHKQGWRPMTSHQPNSKFAVANIFCKNIFFYFLFYLFLLFVLYCIHTWDIVFI